MSYGITTVHAHLDGEAIDHAGLAAWLESVGFSAPQFAGRYFLGHATQAEVNKGQGFCLWGHGEAAPADVPGLIIPIQRADPARQSGAGRTGYDYGFTDGTALTSSIGACLAVGDLVLNPDSQTLVFLEVSDHTELSSDYWAGWATSVYNALLASPLTQVLLPAIFCAFEFDAEAGQYLPDPMVRACLSQRSGYTGSHTYCHGFWARRLEGAMGPEGLPLTWDNLGEFRQQSQVPFSEFLPMAPVPVYYLRVAENLIGWPTPANVSDETLSAVTIEEAADDANDPLPYTLVATPWAADSLKPIPAGSPPDFVPELSTPPTQLGIDTASNLTLNAATIPCLMGSDLKATRLPYDPAAPQTVIDEQHRCSFALRYYSEAGSGKVLTRAEALALSAAKVGIGVCWEGRAPTGGDWIPFVEGLIKPFNDGHGRRDAVTAFTYAAQTILQPPYTPVFFAVDFPVDQNYWLGNPANGVLTPPIETVIDYFQDVQRGYRDYLQGNPAKPYYIGVYGQLGVCYTLYQLGLASHFWQTPWATWGDSRRPFSHLDVWQIATSAVAAMANDNGALKNCAAFKAPEVIWFDLNAAWGDPGVFKVFP